MKAHFINKETGEKLAQITIKDAIFSRDEYKRKAKLRKERIENFKKTHAPQIIIDNEERILKEILTSYQIFDMALDFYEQGARDYERDTAVGTNVAFDNIRAMHKYDTDTPEEKLARILFGSKYIKEEENDTTN